MQVVFSCFVMERNKLIWLCIYGVTALYCILYLLVFSHNNLSKHIELNREIRGLEKNIAETKNRIDNHYTYEELKSNDKLLEQYAREQLNMQKENEDVFVIVYE